MLIIIEGSCSFFYHRVQSMGCVEVGKSVKVAERVCEGGEQTCVRIRGSVKG